MTNETTQLKIALEEGLQDFKKPKKKWQIAYANEAISLEDLKARTTEDNEKELSMKQQLAMLTSNQENIVVGHI